MGHSEFKLETQNESKSRAGAIPVGRGGGGRDGLPPACQCGGGGPGFMSHQQVYGDWFDVAGIMFKVFKFLFLCLQLILSLWLISEFFICL